MNLNLLSDNFEMLADAPDGVPKLREMILQLAVREKLVAQDSDDEPASVLLDKIKAEKEQLIKEKKIRKMKPLPPIEYDKMSYDLPENWQWVRIRDITHDLGQTKPKSRFTYVDVSSINNQKGIISDDIKIIEPDKAPSRARKIVAKGTVIYSTVRPYLLNIAIIGVTYKPKPIVSTAFAVLHPFCGVLNKFLFYYLRSTTFIEFVETEMSGMAYPAISDSKLNRGVIPLPPFNEQKRIVTKVNQLMSLCDELETRKQKRNRIHIALNDAALDRLLSAKIPKTFTKHWQRIHRNFDLLYDNPENVSKLRQAILQLAIQGKLVPQNPDDEPASVLLEKIKAEKERLIKANKIRKMKPLAPIGKDEIPYQLPKKWQWARLGDITQKLGAGSTPRGGKAVYEESGIKFLRSQNVHNNGLHLENVAFIPNEIHKRMKGTVVKPKDILLNITGGSIARSTLVPDNFDEANVSQHVAIVRPVNNGISAYLHKWIISPMTYNTIMGIQVGISREGLSMTRLKDFLVPLPPLSEQKRIVCKIDKLMAICNNLESKLAQSKSDCDKLLSVIVI